MPYVLLLLGGTLLVTGIKGNPDDFWSLVKGDFFGGKGTYEFWIVSILIIGFLGYITPLRSLSRLFLVLVIIVLFLDNKGFFVQFQNQTGIGA